MIASQGSTLMSSKRLSTTFSSRESESRPPLSLASDEILPDDRAIEASMTEDIPSSPDQNLKFESVDPFLLCLFNIFIRLKY